IRVGYRFHDPTKPHVQHGAVAPRDDIVSFHSHRVLFFSFFCFGLSMVRSIKQRYSASNTGSWRTCQLTECASCLATGPTAASHVTIPNRDEGRRPGWSHVSSSSPNGPHFADASLKRASHGERTHRRQPCDGGGPAKRKAMIFGISSTRRGIESYRSRLVAAPKWKGQKRHVSPKVPYPFRQSCFIYRISKKREQKESLPASPALPHVPDAVARDEEPKQDGHVADPAQFARSEISSESLVRLASFAHDRAKAVEILVKDLKVFASFNEELFKEITQLLTLENFRQVTVDSNVCDVHEDRFARYNMVPLCIMCRYTRYIPYQQLIDTPVWYEIANLDLNNVKFKVNPCLFIVQAALMKDATISVNRCLWSPDGSIFGISSKPTSYFLTTSDNGIKILANPDGLRLAAMDNNRTVDIKPKISDDSEKIKNWKLADIVDSAHLKALRLPDSMTTSSKVCLFSLKVLFDYSSYDNNPEEATACIALSKNDSYVMSASGGKVKTKLKGHQKKITGLAFSQSLNVLVSSGADAQVYASSKSSSDVANFLNLSVGVFEADSLRLRCRIAPTAYISSSISSSGAVYPMVIAAHPSEQNQIALGMTDGTVHVVEPSDADSKWGVAPPQENGVLPAIAANPANSSQVSDPPPR
ncbi:hypothetical protein B296_00030967, partial [Ensete ventricosum]